MDLVQARLLARRHADRGTPLHFFGAETGPWVPDSSQIEDVIPSVRAHLATKCLGPDRRREGDLLNLLDYLLACRRAAPVPGTSSR